VAQRGQRLPDQRTQRGLGRRFGRPPDVIPQRGQAVPGREVDLRSRQRRGRPGELLEVKVSNEGPDNRGGRSALSTALARPVAAPAGCQKPSRVAVTVTPVGMQEGPGSQQRQVVPRPRALFSSPHSSRVTSSSLHWVSPLQQ
jgi:hypothetical protein